MKPILFNTGMVRGVDAGIKTVTRRVVKEPWYIEDAEVSRVSGLAMHIGTNRTHMMPYPDQPYRPGDILYVRETWSPVFVRPKRYLYKADAEIGMGEGTNLPIKWRPSIHMPKEAARLFLRVAGLKVQRVQDITDEEARREGCAGRADFRRIWNGCYAKPRPVKGEDGKIDHYESWPWEDIRETRTHKGKPWHVIGNPWVWVIEFQRITKEETGG